MTSIELCIDGSGQFVTTTLDALPDILADEGAFAWVDVDVADHGALLDLQERFGLYRIAVESALSEQERSKIILFDDMIYVEFYGLRDTGRAIAADDIGMFVGERFLITARRNNQPSLDPLRQRWQDELERFRHAPPSAEASRLLHPQHPAPTSVKLLYTLLDDLVDGYFPVMDTIGDRVEELEDAIIAGAITNPQEEIQEIRSGLLKFRRLLSPEEAVLNTLLRRDVPIIDESMVPYFADVHGHLLRIHDWLETYRDQVSSLVDLQISLQSNRLNETMRTLTAWSIILMVCGLIAGIYGMNFEHMPELREVWGFPYAIGLMLLVTGVLVVFFRQRGWWKG
jgi:magnesium transporter